MDLARTSGKGIPQLAADLGIQEQALRGWIKRAEIDAGRGRPRLTTDEREELRRLRRENHVLRREQEILKKAAAYFARETLAGATGSSTRASLLSVTLLCRVLGVAPGRLLRLGAPRGLGPRPGRSGADCADRAGPHESRRTYGAPRVHAALGPRRPAAAPAGWRG